MASAEQPGTTAAEGQEPIPGYRLLQQIGRGGYGEVWKTLAPGGVSKAIKLISGGDPAHSVTELRALNRIKDVRHPFLLSIERIEPYRDGLAIVTELGDCNLQEYFERYRRQGQNGVPQTELLNMLRDVADVLDYIYQEYALQHLDIKPANLLVFGRRLKVADFGLVKNIYERSVSLVDGLTPTYAAPEVFEGQPTRASDQYSLAIVYQEMLTGQLPFDGVTAAKMATQHLRATPNLDALPRLQQPIVARALSKDPLQRYPDCTTFLAELTAAEQRAAAATAAGRPMSSGFSRGMMTHAAAPIPPTAAPTSTPSASAPVTTSTPTQVQHDTHTPQPRAAGTHVANARVTSTEAAGSDASGVPADGHQQQRPTLVIGIGGTGAAVMQRLRLRIGDRLGGMDSLPTFRLLLIDLDPETLNEVNRDQRTWSELETIATPLRNSAEYREQGREHRRWLSRRWLFNVPRNLRTEGLRPLGRLALMSNCGRVLSATRAAILKVTSALRSQTPIPPRVLLVTSINGGTGSGMVLDLAYAVRSEFAAAGINDVDVDALLMHGTPHSGQRDKAILNAVATLRELQHYSRPGSYYPGEPLLQVAPFHGNNATFRQTHLVHLGDDLDAAAWGRAVDDVAELAYCRLLTPLGDTATAETGTAGIRTATSARTVNIAQLGQIGSYSGQFVDDLTRQLCVEVVENWCGTKQALAASGDPTHNAATMLLNALESQRSARSLQLAAAAEQQIQACGVDIERLITHADNMLQQELGQSQVAFLQAQFEQAVAAGEQSQQAEHQLAELVIALQDRALGLDFGERPTDNSRNTLFDLLSSRLTSQAMQIAARFAAWVCELIDTPDVGVDAARHAAEAGRNSLRDLISLLGRDIRELQKRQTTSRIGLTSPRSVEDQPKAARSWLRRRVDPLQVLQERLIEHGQLSFEELLLVCVQWQLRAIETHASALIEQLLGMWQELKQLGKTVAAGDVPSALSDGGAASSDELRLRKLLVDHRQRLVHELHSRVEFDVFGGPCKLKSLLQHRGEFDKLLGLPLKRHARDVVLQSMQEILSILLQNPHGVGSPPLQIQPMLQALLEEPARLPCGQPRRPVLLVPQGTAQQSLTVPTSTGLQSLAVLEAPVNSLAVSRESTAAPISTVIQRLTLGCETLLAIAENLYTRIDVKWDSSDDTEPVSESEDVMFMADGDAVDVTMRLS